MIQIQKQDLKTEELMTDRPVKEPFSPIEQLRNHDKKLKRDKLKRMTPKNERTQFEFAENSISENSNRRVFYV